MRDAFGVERGETVSKISAGLARLAAEHPERLARMRGYGGDWARGKVFAHESGKKAIKQAEEKHGKGMGRMAPFTNAGKDGQQQRLGTDWVERRIWGKQPKEDSPATKRMLRLGIKNETPGMTNISTGKWSPRKIRSGFNFRQDISHYGSSPWHPSATTGKLKHPYE